ncbi:MAG TPA: adenylate cyclase [Lentisphaeria bacterium]|nr:MAG: adenylate cyclase [Lentisphaerae bacterium GWF2_38_69]HBM15606.1 adenylate cyclase [Lentisphaeria bacterium]
MPIEIERKFLVRDSSWMKGVPPIYYCQGYISTHNGATVRVRIGENKAYLCIKSIAVKISRSEFEYPIPIEDAKAILDNLCARPLIEKNRYKIKIGNLLWEIDVFEKNNKGLIIAEVELEREDQDIELPPWILREVTGDRKYYNSMLVQYPYSKWTNEEKGL